MNAESRRAIGKGLLIIAGALLLYETLFGCVALLGIGFSTAKDIILVLCLTMPFPLFLISLRSVLGASIGLWILFAIQTIDFGWNGSPPQLLNPLTNWYGIVMFVASILVTLAAWISSRGRKSATEKSAPGSASEV